jgi:predicted acetyltransferase
MQNPPEGLRLIAPEIELQNEFEQMIAEYLQAGEKRYKVIQMAVRAGFKNYIHRLQKSARAPDDQHQRFQQFTFWMTDFNSRIIGTCQLRPQLTPGLEHEGGNISYSIRPSERGKGLGTRILALTLEKARALGLEQLLITCDQENIASARIIEKNEGVLINHVISLASGKRVSRYEIKINETGQ